MSKPEPATWHVLTGEYPPDRGGVADYSRLVAEHLKRVGIAVEVWCPERSDSPAEPATSGDLAAVAVHRITGLLAPLGWLKLHWVGPRHERVILVQYVPHGWGWHAMNLGFCLGLLWQGQVRREDVRVMFHEVAMPFALRPLRHGLQALVHRVMAILLLSASRRVYVSTPAWGEMLSRLSLGLCRPIWLPVPSNIPRVDDPSAVQRARATLTEGGSDALVIGHFASFGGASGDLLRESLAWLAEQRANLAILLLGHGATAFSAALLSRLDPRLGTRIRVQEDLDPRSLSIFLQACDLLLQPYPDGVTTRRGSTMAALANGVPLVTNLGPLSEQLWTDHQIAATAPKPDAIQLAEAARALMDDPELGRRLALAGSDHYRANFSLVKTVDMLLSADA